MSEEINENQLEGVNGGAGDRYTRYTVVRADTITRIAQRFGTVQNIYELNPMVIERKELRVGWILLVPDYRQSLLKTI